MPRVKSCKSIDFNNLKRYIGAQEVAGWPLRNPQRKVRTPQGGKPANGRAERSDGECHREDTACPPSGAAGKGEKAG